jgi:hypothetical protein
MLTTLQHRGSQPRPQRAPWTVRADPRNHRPTSEPGASNGVPDDAAARGHLPRLQTRDDTIEHHPCRRYWKDHYLPELSDHAVGALLNPDPADPTLPDISLLAYGGAIADLDDDATAFRHHNTRFEHLAAVESTDPDALNDREPAPRPHRFQWAGDSSSPTRAEGASVSVRGRPRALGKRRLLLVLGGDGALS